MILTADWHLVDTPSEEYRWDIFSTLIGLSKNLNDKVIFILGDLCDRKDRHSASLVTRLVGGFRSLLQEGCVVHIIMGNHDIPLSGDPYWSLLNELEGDIHFYWKPAMVRVRKFDILLLPFSPQPAEDWKEFTDSGWEGVDMIFMHQPVDGALTEHGVPYSGAAQLPLPHSIPIYSGDIHTPQKIRNITYVGAPHVINFGDMYECRMLQIHADKVYRRFMRNGHRKWMIRASSIADIKEKYDVRPGHQVKVEFTIPIAEIDKWPGIQADLRVWAADNRVDLVSMEALVAMVDVEPGEAAAVAMDSFEDDMMTLTAFAKKEGLSMRSLKIGVSLLEEAKDDRA